MKIEEILVNPIENGIEYIGEKQHPRIEIGCRTKSHETMFFAWANRMGMDPRQHLEVFRLFYKAKKKSEKIGAGLAIVNRIVKVNGRINRWSLGVERCYCIFFVAIKKWRIRAI